MTHRRRTAEKLYKPELDKIPCKNLRNYSGAQFYLNLPIRDPIAVMRHLRHKKLETTMHYIRAIVLDEDPTIHLQNSTIHRRISSTNRRRIRVRHRNIPRRRKTIPKTQITPLSFLDNQNHFLTNFRALDKTSPPQQYFFNYVLSSLLLYFSISFFLKHDRQYQTQTDTNKQCVNPQKDERKAF